MNKIEKAFDVIDRKVDRQFGFLKVFFKKYFAIISTVLLATFMVLLVVRIMYTRPRLIASIMNDDIKLITLALDKIDDTCNILRVTEGNTDIDFLNVKSFEGSQIGPLVLAYPKKWEGPYLSVNPTIQEKHYEIIQAKDGFFVVPGKGVELPNKQVVGEDFQINEHTAIGALLEKDGPLRYGDKVFASKLVFKIGDWDAWYSDKDNGDEETKGDKGTVDNLGRLLKEFHEAMPYTHLRQGFGGQAS